MSNELIQETIQCLIKTFNVTSNEERAAAESRLQELCNNCL